MKYLEPIEKSISGRFNQSLPTFEELTKHELLSKIVHPLALIAFKDDAAKRWELIAHAVDTMVTQLTGTPFFEEYSIEHETAKGYAIVYDHRGEEHIVSGMEFWCLIKFMFCTYLEIPLSDKTYKRYIRWKSTDIKLCRILD